MKRSEINEIIKRFEARLSEFRFALPGFCAWTPEEWKDKGHEYDEIRDNMLGWDVTDYGEGGFARKGLALITLRNGNIKNPKYTKTYAEKIMMSQSGQVSPLHFHWNKMEDIINRGGGDIVFRLFNADRISEEPDRESEVVISKDGRNYSVKPGEDVILKPGESMSLYPYCYHEFVVRDGPVLIGEVSMCNDDNTDNRFSEPLGRFPAIEEDEPPYRLLCNEYPAARD
ncbi:MAG: D-lyxose/D-mannose family sugar isomerase [Oscillospiraceae bacterium]|jgi:D-lyxose ketol-isomerase|nr:D-lyxose/D-mannose family sugar isomerase [Oscillospiraceae bacterium]